MKGGSTSQQTKSLMQLLGGVTFVVAILLGLYVATRDPVEWGNAEWLAAVRVVLLFLTAIVFFLIANGLGHHKGGKGGKDGYCPPAGGHHGGHHGGQGGRGYSFGSSAGVASVGNDDLTDTA